MARTAGRRDRVCAAIARLYADAGYHSTENRRFCLAEGILPLIGTIGEPDGSGLDSVRCVVEHANAWLLANKRFGRRSDRLTIIIGALLTATRSWMPSVMPGSLLADPARITSTATRQWAVIARN